MNRKRNQDLICSWIIAISAFLLVGAFPGETVGQAPGDIVRWTASGPVTAKSGGNIFIELNAEIEDGWHIYSISQLAGGPVTSVISFPGKQVFKRNGEMQVPTPNKSFDQNFKMETETYEGKINFKIPVLVENNTPSGDQKIAVDVLFQTCSETTCLPPYTSHLFIPIKIMPTGGTVSAETPTPGNNTSKPKTADSGSNKIPMPKPVTVLMVGDKVPDLDFVDFTGKQRKLSEFQGKFVLLDFWATWCRPCLADIPKLKVLYDKYKAEGFEIVGMDSETLSDDEETPDPEFVKETTERAKQIVKTRGANWTHATTETAVPIAKKVFGVKVLPTKILLDKEGKIIATIGEKDDLTGIVEKLLNPGK